MDVRCEKCMTVYEFDDSKVGEQGVTVKCTQCGNLFKVKRREHTAELAMGAAAARSPAYVQPAQSVPSTQRTTVPGIPVINKRRSRRRPTACRRRRGRSRRRAGRLDDPHGVVGRDLPLSRAHDAAAVDRRAQGDARRRDLALGDQWKRLGGIAELASFFHIVEQAAAVARADGPRAAAEAANAAYSRQRATTMIRRW